MKTFVGALPVLLAFSTPALAADLPPTDFCTGDPIERYPDARKIGEQVNDLVMWFRVDRPPEKVWCFVMDEAHGNNRGQCRLNIECGDFPYFHLNSTFDHQVQKYRLGIHNEASYPRTIIVYALGEGNVRP